MLYSAPYLHYHPYIGKREGCFAWECFSLVKKVRLACAVCALSSCWPLPPVLFF